jgi:hypothetical protein
MTTRKILARKKGKPARTRADVEGKFDFMGKDLGFHQEIEKCPSIGRILAEAKH